MPFLLAAVCRRRPGTSSPRAFAALAGLVVCSLLVPISRLAAQDWRGQGRAQGVVVDEERAPVAGAHVALTFEETGSGPPAVTTDRRGRWTLPGLAEGRWRIAIEAAGYATAEGAIEVPAGPAPSVTVQLLPERATVRGMIERGNALLADGEVAAARLLYETALGGLAREDLPEVLRAVARTHYLEGDLASALENLQQALLYGPTDATTRQIAEGVAAQAGRSTELAAWLRRLEAEGAGALLAEGGGPLGWKPPERPLRPAAPEERGRFRTVFAQRSPLGAIEVFAARYGTPMADIEATDPRAARYDLADESFELYVPESCSPAAPCGVLVWTSPGSSGGIPDAEIVAELDRRRLIWIGANRAGNQRLLWDRMALALDAATNVLRIYPTDPARVWAGGYSGGGRTSSALAVLYPEIFRGALCFMGVDFYRRAPIPSRPGAHWPAAFHEPSGESLARVRGSTRLAFVTGQFDYNRAQIEVYDELYRRDGFRHVDLVLLPGMTHYDGFPAVAFTRGLDALEPPD